MPSNPTDPTALAGGGESGLPEALRSLTRPYQIEMFNQRVLDWLGQDSSEAGAFIYGGSDSSDVSADSNSPSHDQTRRRIDPSDTRDSSVVV